MLDYTEDALKNWFVIQTYAGKENLILNTIKDIINLKSETLYPQRKLYIRKKGNMIWEEKALYPGYFFIKGSNNLDYNNKLYTIINRKRNLLPGFIKVISEKGYPVFCEESEMKTIFKLINKNGLIEESKFYYEGKWVKIIDGPLVGLEGIIRHVNRRKNLIKVEISFLGSLRLVDISAFMVK